LTSTSFVVNFKGLNTAEYTYNFHGFFGLLSYARGVSKFGYYIWTYRIPFTFMEKIDQKIDDGKMGSGLVVSRAGNNVTCVSTHGYCESFIFLMSPL
jgi:hypothetical protein